MMSPEAVREAQLRIAGHVNHTPLVRSSLLDDWLGHRVVFKAEGFQKIGAFKARGALNALHKLAELRKKPEHVVAFSSGNHAQALAYAARLLGIRATLFIPSSASSVKQRATAGYGAEVVLTNTRQEAEAAVEAAIAAGAVLVHAYDNDDIIAGQGTACLEALEDGAEPDAVFATCGGGGWLSGAYLATQLARPTAEIYGAEPLDANDAARSLRDGAIFRFPVSPKTIADGAQTLAVSPRTFAYLQQLDGMYEVPEEWIFYWTQWLTHVLKVGVEPTSAVAMAGAWQWLQTQSSPKTVLVLLSGANIDPQTQVAIWAKSRLDVLPGRQQPSFAPS